MAVLACKGRVHVIAALLVAVAIGDLLVPDEDTTPAPEEDDSHPSMLDQDVNADDVDDLNYMGLLQDGSSTGSMEVNHADADAAEARGHVGNLRATLRRLSSVDALALGATAVGTVALAAGA